MKRNKRPEKVECPLLLQPPCKLQPGVPTRRTLAPLTVKTWEQGGSISEALCGFVDALSVKGSCEKSH